MLQAGNESEQKRNVPQITISRTIIGENMLRDNALYQAEPWV